MKDKVASVVVCTYNRASYITRFLRCMQDQTMSADLFEILVVDDHSTDDTESFCREFEATLSNMHYIRLPENKGKSEAVAIGISKARTQKILFSDDDCLPLTNWVEKMTVLLENHPIVVGGIASRDEYLVRARNISEFHPFMAGKETNWMLFLAGANMGFQKKALERLGDFSSTPYAFDMIMALNAREMGIPIYYSPDAAILHDPVPKSISELWEYEVRRSQVTIRLRDDFRDILRTPFFLRFSLALLIFTPFITLGKTAQIFLSTPGLWRWIYTAPIVAYMKLAWCWGAFKGLRAMGK